MLRRVTLTLFALLTLLPGTSVSGAPCWQPPVAARVVDPFREPPCPYCSGNRGIEYAATPGAMVRAVSSGTVSWSGKIAGVRWVVVLHSDGWRATYGRLAASKLSAGDRVSVRQVIGTTTSEFYFGLRRGERYIDPAPHLGRLVGRPRLIPIDGTMARPAPAPTWACRGSGVAGVRVR